MNQTIRRKIAFGNRAEPGVQSADQGWRLGFARAARDCTGLLVDVVSVQQSRMSLEEVLELPPERSLLALLDGPQAGLGLIILSSELLAALIEMQTTGRVSVTPPLPRRPTRTDAAMVAATIDQALQEMELLLQPLADFTWAGGFRYASFLEDPRPLGLLLEDQGYSVLRADLSLAEGAREGQLILALPAEGRLLLPKSEGIAADTLAPPQPPFTEALAEVAQGVPCLLQGVLARLSLPLQEVMVLQAGAVLGLPEAALDRIQLETPDGKPLARARLGQNRGLRALRLSEEIGAREGSVPLGAAALGGASLGGSALIEARGSTNTAQNATPFEAPMLGAEPGDLAMLLPEEGFAGFGAMDGDMEGGNGLMTTN